MSFTKIEKIDNSDQMVKVRTTK